MNRWYSLGLNALLIALIIYTLFFAHSKGPKNLTRGVNEDVELLTPGPLLNATGQLTEVGWSRRYLKAFTFDDAHPLVLGSMTLTRLRFKKFNFYSLTFDGKIVQVAVANIGYAASVFINVFDFEGGVHWSKSVKFLPLIHSSIFPKLIDDPFSCPDDSLTVQKDDLSLLVRTILETGHCLSRVTLSWGDDLRADFTIQRDLSDEDSFSVVPISSDHRYFFYSLKTYNNKCEGDFHINGKAVKADPRSCIGLVDYGRGVMPYRTSWIWANGSGWTSDGRRLSLNLGEGLADLLPHSAEDWVKLDGRVIKLNPVEIVYDPDNLMDGVSFKTASGFTSLSNSANIHFQPHTIHVNSENLLLMATSLTYVYGTYSGRFYDYQGQVVHFEGMHGIVEFANLRW